MKPLYGFLLGIVVAYFVSNPTRILNLVNEISSKFNESTTTTTTTQTKQTQVICRDLGPFFVFRYGLSKEITFSSCDTYRALVENVKTLHQDPKIFRFVTLHGNNITEVSEINDNFIALDDNERFFWPVHYIGYETKVPVGDRVVTVRTLSDKPRLFELENLLSAEECDEMIAVAQEQELVKSTIGETAELGVYDNAIRTSTNTWIGPSVGKDSPVFKTVRERIFELTKLPEYVAEAIQVVHYGVGQHFFVHHDYNDPNSCIYGYCRAGGNRLITVLFYLNDVEEGGETTFPYANNTNFDPYRNPIPYSAKCGKGGIWVKPKKGSAVMFYSLQEKGHMEGKVDPYSMHAGCDVAKGEKWAANLWIRNKRVNGKLIDDNW